MSIDVMILITALLLPLIWNQQITRFEGVLLVGMLVAYLAFVLRTAKTEGTEAHDGYKDYARGTVGPYSWRAARDAGLIMVGIAGLLLGAFVIQESSAATCSGLLEPERASRAMARIFFSRSVPRS